MKRRNIVPTTPELAEVTLPPVEYPEEAEAFLETLEYKFPPCAGCPK
jgi:hypothetical protein